MKAVFRRAMLCGLWGWLAAGAYASAAEPLFSFEDGTTQGWVAPRIEGSFNDWDAVLAAVEGPGNTDGDFSLQVIGTSGNFQRNALVFLNDAQTALMNEAIVNEWNFEFDWTVVKSENPDAQGYTGQLGIATATEWRQVDLYASSGFAVWDPAGDEEQTMHLSIPLNGFGTGTRGFSGSPLSGTDAFFALAFAQGGGNESGATRTYYLDNFRFVDPNAPTGPLGDFNANQSLDVGDIDLLTSAVRAAETDSKWDLDKNGILDGRDRFVWVDDLRKTYMGDANLDGIFDSGDLVSVFIVGEYEDGTVGNSTWSEGDWSGDGDFDSGDFVVSFTAGGYEAGPRAAVAAVPEPACGLWLAAAAIFGWRFRHGRRW